MSKWGACIDWTACTADVVDTGGAVGTWDAEAGTFTVQLEASAGEPEGTSKICAGANNNRQWSELRLRLNGSGLLTVAISGTGETYDEGYELATAELDGTLIALSDSPGGAQETCAGEPLVERQNDSPVQACACSELVLRWDTIDVFWHGAWTCTFTLSVS